MMRSFVKMFCSLSAVAMLAMLASTALAGDLGSVKNGDMELESRFAPHGTPGVDHPNGYADAWHHSSDSAWSNGTTDPVTSGIHSLYIPDGAESPEDPLDDGTFDHDEMRSFARALTGVGQAGRVLNVSWNWQWDITSALGDEFSATVRISTAPVVSLDLVGAITDYNYTTGGAASSGGFQSFLTSIPLAAADASFDIIFRTRDGDADFSETGVMFVDDVSAGIPEPATMGLLGLSGLALMMVRRRRSD